MDRGTIKGTAKGKNSEDEKGATMTALDHGLGRSMLREVWDLRLRASFTICFCCCQQYP